MDHQEEFTGNWPASLKILSHLQRHPEDNSKLARLMVIYNASEGDVAVAQRALSQLPAALQVHPQEDR